MPDRRYSFQQEPTGSWSVIDGRTGLSPTVRGRILTGMPMVEAYDAAELLNLIDDWRNEPVQDWPGKSTPHEAMAALLKAM